MSKEAVDSSVAVAEAPLGMETELVGSLKSSRRKKNNDKNALGVVATKTAVATTEPTQVSDAVEEEKNSTLLEAELEILKGRFSSREGTKLELDDADGEDIHQFDTKLRDGHLGKRANGKSTYKVMVKHDGFPVGDKQLRRLHDRWKLILEFRSMGVVEPRLGVTIYDAVRKMPSLDDKLEALRDAEKNALSVAKLRKKYFASPGIEPAKDWRTMLHTEATRTICKLGEIHELMVASGERPDELVMGKLDDISATVSKFTVAFDEEVA